MNTFTDSIPTVFNPETAFAISLHNADKQRERSNEAFIPFRFALPTEDEFTWHGLPESALHD